MGALPPRSHWRVRHETVFPAPPSDDGLIEPDVDALSVRIVVQQDGFVTGWDDGAMGFEEDAVWFSGQTTSCRIVASDVVAIHLDRRDAGRMTVGRLLHLGFPLRHPSRSVSLRVAVLEAPGRRDWQDEERLAMEILRLWQRDDSTGESQYPPLSVRPGARIYRADPNASVAGVAGLTRAKGPLGGLLRLLFRNGPMQELGHGHGLDRLRRALAREGE